MADRLDKERLERAASTLVGYIAEPLVGEAVRDVLDAYAGDDVLVVLSRAEAEFAVQAIEADALHSAEDGTGMNAFIPNCSGCRATRKLRSALEARSDG